MPSSYILSAARTPIGKFLGGCSALSAPELAAPVLAECLKRGQIPAADVDEVILGQVLGAGCGMAPARQAALKAGLPPTVSAWTVNKMCGSGLQAVMLADQAIRAGEASVVLAGGMESMSRAPHLLRNGRLGWKAGPGQLDDAAIFDGLWCSTEHCHMGELADWTAETQGISRAEQDAWAVQSHQRAQQARVSGVVAKEIVPLEIPGKKGTVTFAEDECLRPETTVDGLARLSSAFTEQGTVTAGNASALSDGAAAVLVVDESRVQQVPVGERIRIVASFTSGLAPREIFLAPITAIQGVLAKARLSIQDIDLIELNEAFAAQSLAAVQELQLDPARVNVRGGAIALGHPIGASGARVLVTLISSLRERQLRYGLASLCLGGGNAVAMIIERI